MGTNILERDELLDRAFTIATTEADQPLRSAMFHQIAKHPGCTTSILEEIVQIGDKSSRSKAASILEGRKST
jgi:hypothetical protein